MPISEKKKMLQTKVELRMIHFQCKGLPLTGKEEKMAVAKVFSGSFR